MIQQISKDLLWGQIVSKAWCDESFMKRLFSDPRNVLAENGMDVPQDLEVKVLQGAEVDILEDGDTGAHFVLPLNPPDDMTDEDLAGDAVAWFCGACGACGRCGGCGCRCACRCF